MLVRPSQVDGQVVSKVTLKRDRRLVFLKELRRMNIHEASLFPGLDGFARSLGDKLKISIAAQTEQRRQQMLENAKNYRRKKADAS
jgi:ribosome recycling factor